MVKKDLMSRITRQTKFRRNRFDCSTNRLFTSPAGMLLPVYCRELTPGTHVSMSLNSFARTLPMQKANFARMSDNYDVFFVPTRLICKDAENILTGTPVRMVNSDGSTVPPNYVPYLQYSGLTTILGNSAPALYDACGHDVKYGARRLADLLGYTRPNSYASKAQNIVGEVVNPETYNVESNHSQPNFDYLGETVASTTKFNALKLSLLPILAYQKIYADYYRNKLWEDENVNSYCAIGGLHNNTAELQRFFTPRYADFDKDRIFGMIPDSGNVLSVGMNLMNTLNVPTEYALGTARAGNSRQRLIPSAAAANAINALVGDLSDYNDTTNLVNYFNLLSGTENTENPTVEYTLFNNGMLRTAFSRLTALNLRRMEALQRFAEVVSLNKDDYKHQINALFGADVPDANSYYSQYLGGKTSPVNVSDVEQTSPESSSSGTKLGDLAGRGTSFGSSANIDFNTMEHGYLMIIYHLQPQVVFDSNGFDPQLFRFGRYDFMIPQFGDLGFEPVFYKDLVNPQVSATNYDGTDVINPFTVLGYLPRYWAYKTDVDRCFGNFSNFKDISYQSYVLRYSLKSYYDRISWSPTFGSPVDYRFFKVFPAIVNPLFYTAFDVTSDGSTDEFINSLQVNVIYDLPLSVDGLPY